MVVVYVYSVVYGVVWGFGGVLWGDWWWVVVVCVFFCWLCYLWVVVSVNVVFVGDKIYCVVYYGLVWGEVCVWGFYFGGVGSGCYGFVVVVC